jgi:predicted O-methyltransferase YrrM
MMDEAPDRRPSATVRPPRRPWRSLIALRKTLAVDRAFWRRPLWTSLRLAREAQRRGAMQKVAELAPLLALLARRRPTTVVEIGTYRGGCFFAFCRVADRNGTLVSVDLPGGMFGGGYNDEELRDLRGYGLPGQSLHFVAADSQDAATRDAVVARLDGRRIDFLMIDGDHRYEGVRRDFELYSPFVGSDGLIALHDILPHPEAPLCQVDIFWNEVKSDYRHVELVDAAEEWGVGQWGGIGVLFPDRV